MATLDELMFGVSIDDMSEQQLLDAVAGVRKDRLGIASLRAKPKAKTVVKQKKPRSAISTASDKELERLEAAIMARLRKDS